ncbi:hypothetical protein QUF51_13985 [Bacillus pumilus]|nr:hypothetical protein [Bacillus pumilus]OLP64083.1 hypothetical protein BACPU_28300 [Bacillus pumilus]
MNIEHPMVTQINDFGYPKCYWSYDLKRCGYQTEREEGQEGADDDETPVEI